MCVWCVAEKLDQTIAEFDSASAAARRHSMHSLDQPPATDPKVASVRAAHTMKRVSVIEMMGTNGQSPTPPPVAPKSGMAKLSPAEMRIKKYHKKGGSLGPSFDKEYSKSTPDLADMDFSGEGAGVGEVGVRQGDGRCHHAAATWSKSHTPTMTVAAFVSDMGHDAPDVPIRAPMPKRRAPSPPAQGEVVAISTGTLPKGQGGIYANVAEDIAARSQRQSQYESSFRPGTSAAVTDEPTVVTQSLHNARLDKRRSVGSVSSLGSSVDTQHGKASAVSFAEDRVYASAKSFMQRYPNASLLVTADIHDKDGPPADDRFYEPEPDYDVDSPGEDDLPRSSVSSSVRSADTTHTRLSAYNDVTPSSLRARDGGNTVTVISVGKSKASPPVAPKQGAMGSKPASPPHSHMSSSLHSSPERLQVVSGNQSLSTSANSSRRDSATSNASLASSGGNLQFLLAFYAPHCQLDCRSLVLSCPISVILKMLILFFCVR